jgi:hypothetical protein
MVGKALDSLYSKIIGEPYFECVASLHTLKIRTPPELSDRFLMADESTPVIEQETGFLLDKSPLLWQNPATI